MSVLLDRAFAEASKAFADLPERQKDAIGTVILEELEKWRKLRAHIQRAELSGPAQTLDMDAVIKSARAQWERKE